VWEKGVLDGTVRVGEPFTTEHLPCDLGQRCSTPLRPPFLTIKARVAICGSRISVGWNEDRSSYFVTCKLQNRCQGHQLNKCLRAPNYFGSKCQYNSGSSI
jgi:hypothetical protein